MGGIQLLYEDYGFETWAIGLELLAIGLVMAAVLILKSKYNLHARFVGNILFLVTNLLSIPVILIVPSTDTGPGFVTGTATCFVMSSILYNRGVSKGMLGLLPKEEW